MFNYFHIEFNSFWLGFISGVLTLGIILRIRVVLPDIAAWFAKRYQTLHLRMTKSTEHRLRQDIVQHTQQLHLAASLFSLDEVIIEPRLMYPILHADVNIDDVYLDITSEVIPHMAEWPELASHYGAATFTIASALTGGANIAIIGRPGSGKSTALAYLACQLARKTSSEEMLKNRLPLFVHVLDLQVHKEYKEVFDPILEALNSYTSALTQTRLGNLVRSYLQAGQTILILDGLDELTQEEASDIVTWLSNLVSQYPDLQIITATRVENTCKLEQLNFQPLAITAWNEVSRCQFFERWAQLWNQHITPLMHTAFEAVDPLILSGWLKSASGSPTPFEATLKAWAVFSGDSCSGDLASLMDWYVRRITTNTPYSYRALERMAAHLILQEKSYLPIDEFRKQSYPYEMIIPQQTRNKPEDTQGDVENEALQPNPKLAKTSGLVSSGSQLITLFVNQGVLISHKHSHIRFNHICLLTFLAGHAFASDESVTMLIGQDGWFGKWQTLGFAGRYADLSDVIQSLLSKSKDDILANNLFQIARWLSIAATPSVWRTSILRALTALVHQRPYIDGLAVRAMVAIALSGDSAVGLLFRQWLKSDQSNLRRLGALGCGFVKDAKAVQDLSQIINDPDQSVGKSACLALVSIGNKAALDIVVDTLLHGNEDIRRAAAEALTNHSQDGLRILTELAADEDLLVRRSVVFGFMRSRAPVLIQMLERMVIEDKQWVVRNAASNALEVLRQPNPYTPKMLPPVTDLPWLIHYAGKLGIGIQPGKPAQELICSAIDSGDDKEKLLALDYVRIHGEDYAVQYVYQAFKNGKDSIRQAAYNALLALAASGGRLPSLSQLEARSGSILQSKAGDPADKNLTGNLNHDQ